MEMWKESQLKQFTYAKRIETAYPILESFVRNIGFRFCSIRVTSTERRSSFKAVDINNFPRSWNSQYDEQKYIEIDPVIAHCKHSMLPIVWSPEVFLEAPQIWEALQQQGLQYGWSQSFHHEESGLCIILSLARPYCSISSMELYEHYGYMFYVTSHLSELFARTLPAQPEQDRKPRLTAREIEVLKLSAGGKTAYECAIILSLSERTVSYHIHNVIEKLKVCNKLSAVIAATRAGII